MIPDLDATIASLKRFSGTFRYDQDVNDLLLLLVQAKQDLDELKTAWEAAGWHEAYASDNTDLRKELATATARIAELEEQAKRDRVDLVSEKNARLDYVKSYTANVAELHRADAELGKLRDRIAELEQERDNT